MQLLFGFLVVMVLAVLIGAMGEKRRIGSTYSFLISITLSPLIGFIVTLLSPSLKSYKAYEEISDVSRIFGIIFSLLGGWLLYETALKWYEYHDIPDEYYHPTYWPSLVIAAGLVILGYYLNFLPKHKKPDDIEPPKPVQKVEIKPKEIINKERKPIKIRFKKAVLRKVLYGVLIFIALLVITNPSAQRFKEYRGENSYSGLKREQNWIIFSVYSDGGVRFLGILLNFFTLK